MDIRFVNIEDYAPTGEPPPEIDVRWQSGADPGTIDIFVLEDGVPIREFLGRLEGVG